MTDATTNLLMRLECPSPPPGSPIAPLILSFDPAAATVSLILGTSVLGVAQYTPNSPVPVHLSVDQATNFAVTVGGTSLFVGPWNAPGFPTCSDIRTMVLIASNGSGASAGAAWVDDICIGDEVGSRYCLTAPNTTGQSGSLTITGADHVALNTLTLTATSLVPNQFGMFYCSQTTRQAAPAAWPSNGYLCVGDPAGRFNDPSQILFTGAQGSMSLQVDLTQVPEGNNLVAVAAGQTWNFQGWYRDTVGFGNNTTDAVAVLFH